MKAVAAIRGSVVEHKQNEKFVAPKFVRFHVVLGSSYTKWTCSFYEGVIRLGFPGNNKEDRRLNFPLHRKLVDPATGMTATDVHGRPTVFSSDTPLDKLAYQFYDSRTDLAGDDPVAARALDNFKTIDAAKCKGGETEIIQELEALLQERDPVVPYFPPRAYIASQYSMEYNTDWTQSETLRVLRGQSTLDIQYAPQGGVACITNNECDGDLLVIGEGDDAVAVDLLPGFKWCVRDEQMLNPGQTIMLMSDDVVDPRMPDFASALAKMPGIVQAIESAVVDQSKARYGTLELVDARMVRNLPDDARVFFRPEDVSQTWPVPNRDCLTGVIRSHGKTYEERRPVLRWDFVHVRRDFQPEITGRKFTRAVPAPRGSAPVVEVDSAADPLSAEAYRKHNVNAPANVGGVVDA